MSSADTGGAMGGSVARIATGRVIFVDLPVGLFGSVIGVTGLSVAWRLAHLRYGVPAGISLAIAAIAVVSFVLMVTAYALKLIRAFAAVREEFRHPIAGNLFGTILISLLQLPIVLEPFSHHLAQLTWVAGAAGMVVFAWVMARRAMTVRLKLAHATPAWIIPLAGVLNLPLALPALALPHVEGLMVASLAIGLFFTVPLFTLIMARLMFEPPLPPALKPSLLVLVTPFAVGYSTYTVTVGRTDLMAESLFALTLSLLAVLLGQLRDLPVCCPFRVSSWSVSFPLAACSVAAVRYAAARPGVITDGIALALLAFATLIIAWLVASTGLILIASGLPDSLGSSWGIWSADRSQ